MNSPRRFTCEYFKVVCVYLKYNVALVKKTFGPILKNVHAKGVEMHYRKNLGVILGASLQAALSSVCWAAEAETKGSVPTSGFYVGANLGMEFLSGKTSLSYLVNGAASWNEDENYGVHPKSIVGGLSFGKRWQSGCMFGGLEAVLGLTNLKSVHRNFDLPIAETGLQKRFSFGGVVLMGLALKECSPSLSVGVEAAQLKLTHREYEDGTLKFQKDKKFLKPVLRIGGRVEKAISENSALQLEYVYRVHGSLKFDFKDPDETTLKHRAGRLRSHAVTVGFLYKLPIH